MASKRKGGGGKRGVRKTVRRRNYRLEYKHRKQRGLARGLSLSQARGHARAGERPRPPNPVIVNPKSKEEAAIRMMKAGMPLRHSAKSLGLSEQYLRRYVKENAGASRAGKRWVFDDQRARLFPVYSETKLKTLALAPEQASLASLFMHAVRQFLVSGDASFLVPYEGQGVADVHGRFNRFETDPNRLYELDSAGELNFPEFYRIIS